MCFPAGSANPEAVKGRTGKLHWQDEGVKNRDADGYERNHPDAFGWKTPRTSSGSKARKAASAKIAKIPLALSQHIARVYKPSLEERSAA